ncbi:MAG: class I SAM-dependent methyltransferase [Planctomycetes bacterium]|jgi:alpha-N-acetylglucosaminidase|nr:class I SAM-dependent methyltransferase [Planctomycetota bacterium]
MKSWLYQVFIQRTTNECYRGSLGYVPRGSHVLDVGIGNGLMLSTFGPLIQSKQLKITGIDINAAYLKHCAELIRKLQLEDHVEVRRASAQDYVPPTPGCFDYVLFCMSFMLLPDQPRVLLRVRDWLKPGGQIVFVQALFRQKSRLVDLIKPKLKYLTTVDFGQPTYEEDFFALLRNHRLSVREDRVLKNEWFHSQCRLVVASFQEAPVAISRPA